MDVMKWVDEMRTTFVQAAAIGALFALVGACTAALAQRPGPGLDLDQNWNADQTTRWHEASQGSRLLPLVWLQSLEEADRPAPFLSDENVVRLGYLPSTTRYRQRLPIGFAVDRTPASRLGETNLRWKARQRRDEPWVGMNCSACHTAQITYQTHTLRIEGGPGMADFQTFMEELHAALVSTRDDAAKFERFAKKVLARDDNPENRAQLRDALVRLIRREVELDRLNATPLRYGPGRVDAFGHIYNKVAYSASAADQTPNPSDAPVSYPFLWNVPQHDRLQWNGQVKNIVVLRGREPVDVGALGRNAGEVIGVFADLQLKPGRLGGYRSSVDVENLIRLEQQLGRLRPPAWPTSVFPVTPDREALVQEGTRLFDTRCTSCHARLDRRDLRTAIQGKFSYFNPARSTPRGAALNPPPGTDPWMACNAYTKMAFSGALQGAPSSFFSGRPLEEEDNLGLMLQVSVIGSLVNQAPAILSTTAASGLGISRPPEITSPVAEGLSEREIRLATCMEQGDENLGYKARPLTGIWATAPYLHNGSVRTLYQLLLPEAAREPRFYVGGREFDPSDVGYRSEPGPNRFLFEAVDAAGVPIPGNSNRGHDYNNASLTERDRRALIEYLKTL